MIKQYICVLFPSEWSWNHLYKIKRLNCKHANINCSLLLHSLILTLKPDGFFLSFFFFLNQLGQSRHGWSVLVIISPQAKKQTQSTLGKVTLPDGTAQEVLSVWQDTSHELWKEHKSLKGGSLNCQIRGGRQETLGWKHTARNKSPSLRTSDWSYFSPDPVTLVWAQFINKTIQISVCDLVPLATC